MYTKQWYLGKKIALLGQKAAKRVYCLHFWDKRVKVLVLNSYLYPKYGESYLYPKYGERGLGPKEHYFFSPNYSRKASFNQKVHFRAPPSIGIHDCSQKCTFSISERNKCLYTPFKAPILALKTEKQLKVLFSSFWALLRDREYSTH